MTIKKGDFIEIDYTGKLVDGAVFDTTEEKVAKENGTFEEKMKFGPMVVCVGEQQVLPGLDLALVDKEIGKGYTETFQPEQAFGKRDVKKVRIMPAASFKEHNMQPRPGLQVDVDGEVGTITRVSGGRVIVNFNHPLAGKEVIYDFKILKKVEDKSEQIKSFLNSAMRIPKDKINVILKEDIAEVSLPMNLPEQLTGMIGKKLAELTSLKEIKFLNSSMPKEEQKTN
jgi:FKBP-type peptidyl-prolyl cis-trans isomerase SlyD